MKNKKLLCAILAMSITCNVLASGSHNSSWSIQNFLRTIKNSSRQIFKTIKTQLFGIKKPTVWEKTKTGATKLARTVTSKRGLIITGATTLLAATVFALKRIFWPRTSGSNQDKPKPDTKPNLKTKKDKPKTNTKPDPTTEKHTSKPNHPKSDPKDSKQRDGKNSTPKTKKPDSKTKNDKPKPSTNPITKKHTSKPNPPKSDPKDPKNFKPKTENIRKKCVKKITLKKHKVTTISKSSINSEQKTKFKPKSHIIDSKNLHLAILNSDYETVKRLVENGTDINTTNKNGLTPLDLAIKNSHYRAVRCLIENGADVNTVNKDGLKPLDMAILNSGSSIAFLLKRNNAKINGDLSSYLFEACVSYNLDLIRFLVEYGADLTAKTKNFQPKHPSFHDKCYNGLSALDIAIKNGDSCIIKYLINNNAPIYGDKEKLLLETIPRLSNFDNSGEKAIIKHLLNSNINPNIIDSEGKLPLDKLLSEEYFYINHLENIGEIFIKNGSVISLGPKEYIEGAIRAKQINIIKFLIKSGLNPNEVIGFYDADNNGIATFLKLIEFSKREHAKHNSQTEIIPYLERILKNQRDLSSIANQIGTYLETLNNTNTNALEQLVTNIKQLILDENTPSYAIQEAMPTLFKIHKKYPRIIRDFELKNLLKFIPFNKRFLKLRKFMDIRNFAARYFNVNKRRESIYAKDIFNLTIDEACIIHLKNSNTIDQIVSHKFANTNWFRISKNQFTNWLNTGNTQNNNLLEKLDYAKKMKNKKFYQNLLNMAYVKCLLLGGKMQEITSKIASFLPTKALGEIGNKIPEPNKKLKIKT